MDIDQLQQCIEAFLTPTGNTRSGGAEHVSRNTDLFRTGLLDSLRSIELIGHIEKTYAVRIPLRKMTPDDLRTIENMHRAFERLSLL
jgi:acyl carrier protein